MQRSVIVECASVIVDAQDRSVRFVRHLLPLYGDHRRRFAPGIVRSTPI
jgi:hypothetical protein